MKSLKLSVTTPAVFIANPFLLGRKVLAFLLLFILSGCATVKDEPMNKGMSSDKFKEAEEDYFRDMDGGIKLSSGEVKGRNTWMVYSAGNDAFWDYMAARSFGTIDLLKVITSYPGSKYARDSRFSYTGMINEPGFRKATKPDQYGLWLDERTGSPDPYENAEKYPGVNGGSFYGKGSGIVGLRLFPNPAFDQAALAKWDAKKYYTDSSYYYNKKLVRPYRVGMACSFCHVGPHPLYPPADTETPEWKNLSTNVGAQYLWIGRVFGYDLKPNNFVWQLLNSSPPGALETSGIVTDNINNPRTMNAIYNVKDRLNASEAYDKERQSGNTLLLHGVTEEMHVPHILKDGADSVGILGALTRVYFNIGSFHQEWVRHFNPIVGGKTQTPISVAVAEKNSVYFQLTEKFVGNLAAFFLKASSGHHLKDVLGGEAYLAKDEKTLTLGKEVFADHCAQCHSSKQPPPQPAAGMALQKEGYLDQMRKIVMAPHFLEDNYLSDEKRYPVTEIGTHASAALGTNSIRGHVWNDFSSETYKNLPAVGKVQVHNPLDGSPYEYEMPGGGRGYYRTPSLVSLWSTAPFFHNNSLGKFTNDPSLQGRMEAFDDAAEKLLWPEKRPGTQWINGKYSGSECEKTWNLPFCSPIYRTTEESFIVINKAFLPKILRKLIEKGEDEVRIGPIPKGTPVDLLANVDLEIKLGLDQVKKHKNLLGLLINVKKSLIKIKKKNLGTEESTALLKTLVPDLLAVSKSPDFVVDRGHLFGSALSDKEKFALIGFLKTM